MTEKLDPAQAAMTSQFKKQVLELTIAKKGPQDGSEAWGRDCAGGS